MRLIKQEDQVSSVSYQQLHDVVVTGVKNSINGYFKYYDSVTGEVGHLTKVNWKIKQLEIFIF